MTDADYQNVDLDKIRDLYSSDPVAKAILDDFGARQRSQTKTKVDPLVQRLGGSASRSDVIRILRLLERLGCGKFVVGRWSHPSRFEWEYDLVSIGQAAGSGFGDDADIRPVVETDDDDEADDTIAHAYQLRPDLKVDFHLPVDLTPREAERLGEFIKTLPFDDSE